MNLAFNAVMWGLFTRALTLGSSTVRVSVINTSANFVITAVLGAGIFGEELAGMICFRVLFSDPAGLADDEGFRTLVDWGRHACGRVGYHWDAGGGKGC